MSAAIPAQHRRAIARFAALIVELARRAGPTQIVVVTLNGHEDETGDPASFGVLGVQRAAEVLRTIVARLGERLTRDQAAKLRINIVNFGPSRPIRSNVTADGRARNRRVELLVALATDPSII
jgi:outer membrane protein OmpA-like peptidoglycan-associated protein